MRSRPPVRGQLGSCAERSAGLSCMCQSGLVGCGADPRVGWSVRAWSHGLGWAGRGPPSAGCVLGRHVGAPGTQPPSVPQGLYSNVACPGTMLTNLTYGILPAFVWTLLMPMIWLVSTGRFCSYFT